MSQFLAYLHLLGIVISLGSGLFFVLVFYPSLKKIGDPAERMRVLGGSLRFYHPLFLFGICLTFMSGAIHLTQFKIAFGTTYFERLGEILLWKFGTTLLIFLIAGMQCFGMGLKLARMAFGVIPGDLAKQERYARKIWRAQVVNLVLLAVTLWLGLVMGKIASGNSAGIGSCHGRIPRQCSVRVGGEGRAPARADSLEHGWAEPETGPARTCALGGGPPPTVPPDPGWTNS